ncbi:GGDEF domain-containing protein [Motiliproteus sp.]|uniref:GGDEF domain-containing protein n=1 Tax=Motiliproteus sp. TaxID=1898955 RepID=UPI003BACA235
MADISVFSAQNSPAKLVKLLLVVALFFSVTILGLSSYAITTIYSKQVLQDTETNAIKTSLSVLALEKDHFLHPDANGDEQLQIYPEDFQALDAKMRALFAPLDIVKIKIFSTQGEILYSTDHSIIGKRDKENLRLKAALAGGADSKLKSKDEFTDLQGEKRFEVDVVESYVPIRNSLGMIVGAFEIYQDITASNSRSHQGVMNLLISLALILVVAFSLSFLVVKIAAKELAKIQHKLHDMATLDSLTGLYNRAVILEALEHQSTPEQRAVVEAPRSTFSLVMIDIDHFKSINDAHGHLVGDRVIAKVANSINEALRDCDQLGRYGGEEFLLLLPTTDLDGACSLAERIRQHVESTQIEVDQYRLSVTVSLGVATSNISEATYEPILQRADEALYAAKAAGRNRVSYRKFEQQAFQFDDTQ